MVIKVQTTCHAGRDWSHKYIWRYLGYTSIDNSKCLSVYSFFIVLFQERNLKIQFMEYKTRKNKEINFCDSGFILSDENQQ